MSRERVPEFTRAVETLVRNIKTIRAREKQQSSNDEPGALGIAVIVGVALVFGVVVAVLLA